ncbi:MAG: AraC family transcriptional regulator [Bacteroidales bacterium]|nr:AraC family transcriptional regulator [Bacteroidales bacterium]
MKFSDFCTLNGCPSENNIAILQNCEWPEEPFIPEFNVVMYSHGGEALLNVEGRDYSLSRKCMSVFKSGQKVHIRKMSSSFRTNVLVIGGDIGQELSVSSVFLGLFILDETPVIRVTSEYAEASTLFFGAMERVLRFTSNPYKNECILSLLRAFFYSTGYYLNKALRFDCSDLYRLSVEHQQDKASLITRFINLVEANAQKNRRMSFYSAQLGYNPKYLSSVVKKETGLSGQDLIDQYAILSAMAKLSYSHKSIKEISNEMEFPSQSDFGKFFKRMTGQSPLSYKKQRRSR